MAQRIVLCVGNLLDIHNSYFVKKCMGETMYIIVWEFKVVPGRFHEFISAYKADGDWAKLFGLADGYVGTELLKSVDDEERFVTVDRWRRATDFISFQDRFGEQYRSLEFNSRA